jgi:hypothetical protein
MEARARFTRMRDGTAKEFALIHAGETEYASTLPVRVRRSSTALRRRRGAAPPPSSCRASTAPGCPRCRGRARPSPRSSPTRPAPGSFRPSTPSSGEASWTASPDRPRRPPRQGRSPSRSGRTASPTRQARRSATPGRPARSPSTPWACGGPCTAATTRRRSWRSRTSLPACRSSWPSSPPSTRNSATPRASPSWSLPGGAHGAGLRSCPRVSGVSHVPEALGSHTTQLTY